MINNKDSATSNIDDGGFWFPPWLFIGDPALAPVICLPVPAFSVRFLLQQEGWPLGYFSQIAGEPASGKSALLCEIMRWHMAFPDGGGILLETEGKSADIITSILDNTRRFGFYSCCTLEKWSGKLKELIERVIKSSGSIGHPVPAAFGIDTITAGLPEKVFSAIAEQGFSSGGKPVSGYLKGILGPVTEKIHPWPLSVVGVSHAKPRGRRGLGVNVRHVDLNVVGGHVTKHFQALGLQVTCLNKQRPGSGIARPDDDERGILLRVEAYHNVFARPAHVRVELLWERPRRDSVDPYRQRAFFDWNSASIEPYRTAGEMLEQKIRTDSSFREELYAATGICTRALLKATESYPEQWGEVLEHSLRLERDRSQVKWS